MKQRMLWISMVLVLVMTCCTSDEGDAPQPIAEASAAQTSLAIILDSAMVDDKSFFAHTLKGVERAAEEYDLALTIETSRSELDFESHIENLAAQNPDLVITVGFGMGDATARVARRHKNVKFAIVDVAYIPGFGCPENIEDCYSVEGGLENVTSLIFAEDQVGYLAGVLAACMSKTGVVASVAGQKVLPVVKFVAGFQNGAKRVNPDIQTLNAYLPSFDDPDLGKVTALGFIDRGADVLFGVGGNSGNGALLAAHERGLMAIGVDGDQYFTFPEVGEALLTSASKMMDLASYEMVQDFALGNLKSGIRMGTLENSGVGLAPFHDWDGRIPDTCKDELEEARQAIIANPTITGVTNQLRAPEGF